MALIDVFSYHTAWGEKGPTKPWRHGPWLWATQGHILVALRDEQGESEPTNERMQKGTQYIELTPEASEPVSFAALKKFAGPVAPAHAVCRSCRGSGRSDHGEPVECEHCKALTRTECENCGGDGEDSSLPFNEGRIVGVSLNRSLLAFALAQVPPEETVTIGVLKTPAMKEGSALAVLGAEWRVVLMGTRDHGGTLPSFPNERSGEPEAVAAVAKGREVL